MSPEPEPRARGSLPDGLPGGVRSVVERLDELRGRAEAENLGSLGETLGALVEELVEALTGAFGLEVEDPAGLDPAAAQRPGEGEAVQRLANILESISDAYVALAPDGRITYLNRRAEQLLQRSRAELLGEVVWSAFPELVDSSFAREYRRAVDERVPVAFEEYYAPGRAWMEVHAYPTPDGLTVLFRNITRRKRLEEEQRFLARASDELAASIDYRQTLDRVARLVIPTLGDSCMIYTLEDDGEIRRAAAVHGDPAKREAFERMLSGRPIDPLSTTSPVARALRSGEPELLASISEEALDLLSVDAEHLEVLRQVRPRTLMIVPVISRGRTLGAIALASSDPERSYGEVDLGLAVELARRAALALDNARLYAQARREAHARREILSIVSHDLRNSLNATLLHADLLAAGQPGAKARGPGGPHVMAIRRAAEHMHRMVQDLLDVESIEAGRLSVHPQAVPAATLLAEAVGTFAPLAKSAGVELRLEVQGGLPELHADRGRLHQALGNLIGNAIKFSPAGTTIEVSGRLGVDGQELCFAVRDAGRGIPGEDLERIFDRFWKGAPGRGPGAPGMGLGLPIARGIIEAHGGRIWVESAVGRGTVFHFTLPVPREADG